MTKSTPPPRASASQIKKYKSCPKAFWFRYLSDKRGTKADKGYLAMGSAVHEAIETVLEEFPDLRDRDDLEYKFLNEYDRLVHDHGEYDVPPSMEDDARDCLGMAAKYVSKRTDAEIVGIEDRIHYDISRPDASEEMIGIMDVTTDSEIWDWKTGRVREHDEVIQGAVYMGAFSAVYDRKPDCIKFVYLKEGKVRTLDPTKENWDEMVKWLKYMREGTDEGNYEAEPGDFCYWCSHEFFCDASPAGCGDVDWADY